LSTKIRLSRTGTRNVPFYKIVVVDTRKPRNGRYIECIGYYDPKKPDEQKITVDSERVTEWVKKGSILTDTVRQLLQKKSKSEVK
jgi:small subunit ribosomal protein S16